jgi:hypothetical protein
VLLAKSAGGKFRASVNCTPQPQVVNQCPPSAPAPGAMQHNAKTTHRRTKPFRFFKSMLIFSRSTTLGSFTSKKDENEPGQNRISLL